MSDPISALFANQGLHANARFIAGLHDNAIDYLRQAPVLALCFGAKRGTRADRLYVASRIGGPIQRGEKLRNVMAAVGVPYPLRKLAANALAPKKQDTIRSLSVIDNSTLSQIIPQRTGAQREWLKAIEDYKDRSRWRSHIISNEEFRWLVIQSAQNPSKDTASEAQEIADLVIANGPLNWPAWSWARANAEATLWHDRLRTEKALPAGFKADTCIDLSSWPDSQEVGGFEFFKLSTPSFLMEEGRRMRHCVASYIPDVVNGRCSIFSIRQQMRRVATVEIVGKRIAQLKGFANKPVAKAVETACRQFIESAA